LCNLSTILLGVALAGCASDDGQGEDSAQVAAALGSAGAAGSCKSSSLGVLDIHGDPREIWKGLEQVDSGKQADPKLVVTLDFSASTQASSLVTSFVPTAQDGSCGAAVPAAVAGSVVPADVWGQLTTDAARQPLPSPFNLLVRDRVTGLVSAAGAIAAGKDVTLSSLSVNGTVRQPVGLIAGGKVTLTSGSVAGNVTYGVASTFPQSVTVSGTKTLAPFDPAAAFDKLETLSTLLDEIPSTSAATLSNGTLKLAGAKSGLNVFHVSAEQLRQATSVQISAPAGAGVLVSASGGTVELQNKGISLSGVTASGLLWNFPFAVSLSVSSVGLQGSVLAPRAQFQFGNGSINGTVVARSYAGTGSGSLLHAPLNVSLLLGAAAPSAVSLTPVQPLQRGCSYRLAIPTTQVLSSTGACLASPFGVTFKVAKQPSTPAGRELVNVEADLQTGLLSRFTAKAGINTPIGDVWGRYLSAPGISAAELVPVGAPVKSSTLATQTVQHYLQHAQGYPVLGCGYAVASENGMLRSANGRVVAGIPAAPQPVISAATALQNALTRLGVTQAPWVAKPGVYSAPAGVLALAPKVAYPTSSDFALAWVFQFKGKANGLARSTSVRVDAVTGAILGNYPGRREGTPASPLDVRATYVTQQLSQVETAYHGMQLFNTAQYKNPNGSLVSTLSSKDLDVAGALSTFTGLYYDIDDALQGTPIYVTDPTPTTPWTATESTEQYMAGAQWALELADAQTKSLGLKLNGVPWNAIDGVGHQFVNVNYLDPAHAANQPVAFYDAGNSDADNAYIFFNDEGLTRGPDSVLHEYGHALLASVRRAAGLGDVVGLRESGAFDEGFATLYAVLFNREHSIPTAPWWCYQRGFPSNGVVCIGDTRDPWRSPSGGGQPASYLDQFYWDYAKTPDDDCDGHKNDNCGVHHNTSIITHWAYLLAAGTAGLPSVPCDLKLEPVSAEPADGLRLAINLLLTGSQRIGGNTPFNDIEATFRGVRDATLQVAEEATQAGALTPAELGKVALAWTAMALPPQSSTQSHVEPADGAQNVYPWTTFSWPVDGDGQAASSWDFQLADGPFDTHLKFFEYDVRTVVDGSIKKATLAVSLPSNSTTTYYWRVRPHSDDPTWLGCYPIHTFKGTSVLRPLENLKVIQSFDELGRVIPGRAVLTWDPVPGAVNYVLDAALTDPKCKGGAGVLESTVVPDLDLIGNLDGLEAAEHYFVGAHAVGPSGLESGAPAGDCKTIEIDTGLPVAPGFSKPRDGETIEDRGPIPFEYTAFGGTDQLEIRFFLLEGEQCTTQVGAPLLVPSSCSSVCSGSFSQPLSHPNLGGYCWDVAALAENGTPSARSPRRKLHFYHAQTPKLSPGIDRLLFEGSLDTPSHTAILPGDSFGKDVPLEWAPDPDAFQFGYRLWTFGKDDEPFPVLDVDPPNCTFSGAFSGTSSASCSRPVDVRAEGTTSESGVVIGNGLASSGRYCWNVWPIFADPNDPTRVGPQPGVVLDRENCYTSGPSTPVIVVDNRPGPEYSPTPITGHVEFAYVPDGQYGFGAIDRDTNELVTEPEFVTGPACSLDNPYVFNDIEDCDISFTINPQPGKHYRLIARTWNSDQHPPVADDSTQLPDQFDDIDVPSCGKRGDPCCERNHQLFCTDEKTACNTQNVCEECGEEGQGCCNDPGNPGALYCPTRDGSQLGCDTARLKCEKCGGSGQACCYSPSTKLYSCNSGKCNGQLACGTCGTRGSTCCLAQNGTPECGANLHCASDDMGHGVCQASCGVEGLSCCPGATCDLGLTCDGTTCKKPECQTPSKPVLTGLNDYQTYCTPTGGSVDLATDLTGIPQCAISTQGIQQLVNEGVISCTSGLSFIWPPSTDAAYYEVYYIDYTTGTSGLLQTTTQPAINYPSCSLNTTTQCLEVPSGFAQPLLFTLVVRAVSACGKKSAAGIGMLAVKSTCTG
jgi:choice-of-anchor A domain-containing protein